MNVKKLVCFLVLAFLPMVVVGLFLHFSGTGSPQVDSDPAAALTGILFSAGAMLIPLLAVVFTQLLFKEPALKGLDISFKFNIWWLIGWLLIPVIAFAVLGVSLLMPGAHWVSDSAIIQTASEQLPSGFRGPWGFIAVTVLSGLVTGATFNGLFAFGEEVAWRGFLVKEFKGKKFLTVSFIIGLIWGLWHSPLILNGHNYPDHPVAGVFMMVLMCLALTPILLYFRLKSGSVIVPAIMHGTFNAVIGLSTLFVAPQHDLLTGGPGLSGLLTLLLVDLTLYLYDHHLSKDHLFTTAI